MPIHQEVMLKPKPSEIYDALLSSSKFAKMSGGRAANISVDEGGKSSMFGGDIQARNVELVPARRVVQAWRSGAWPEGVYSIVRFELIAERQGTKLVFDQSGYPDQAHEMLATGWDQMYWQPLNAING